MIVTERDDAMKCIHAMYGCTFESERDRWRAAVKRFADNERERTGDLESLEKAIK